VLADAQPRRRAGRFRSRSRLQLADALVEAGNLTPSGHAAATTGGARSVRRGAAPAPSGCRRCAGRARRACAPAARPSHSRPRPHRRSAPRACSSRYSSGVRCRVRSRAQVVRQRDPQLPREGAVVATSADLELMLQVRGDVRRNMEFLAGALPVRNGSYAVPIGSRLRAYCLGANSRTDGGESRLGRGPQADRPEHANPASLRLMVAPAGSGCSPSAVRYRARSVRPRSPKWL
jgi:hypothetical protein